MDHPLMPPGIEGTVVCKGCVQFLFHRVQNLNKQQLLKPNKQSQSQHKSKSTENSKYTPNEV
ncbi:hypothetical protein Fmac_011717 [Flemingia macrophylla]|uniref:Uncharacterized protein n=1 Tax=Flemingia macrophylla TaxID=520843 RepID=A0ABD1MN90_9FABA